MYKMKFQNNLEVFFSAFCFCMSPNDLKDLIKPKYTKLYFKTF